MDNFQKGILLLAARLLVLVLATSCPLLCRAADPEFTYIIQAGSFGSVDDVQISVDPRLVDNNLGKMHSLDIWQHDGVALLRFDLDLIPKKSVVKKAYLEMYCFSAGFSAQEIARDWVVQVYEFRQRWLEGTGTNKDGKRDGATVSTFDGKDAWPKGKVTASVGTLLGSTVHKGRKAQWYTWELKRNVVNEWLSGMRVNNGLIIWGRAPGKAVSFASSETSTATNKPKLRLVVSIPIRKMIEDTLGTQNTRKRVRRVKKVETFINPENNRITINVDWSIENAIFSDKGVLRNARKDVQKMIRVGHQLGPALSHINIRGSYELVDKFGRTQETVIVNGEYRHGTVAKINWRNFSTDNVFDIADSMTLHPALRKLLR